MIHENAMLVKLSISQWTARKYDKSVSKRTVELYGTDLDAGRWNKVLVAQDAIKRIQKVVNIARTFHYTNTLPWSDDEGSQKGARLLPVKNFNEYTKKMRRLRVDFDAVVSEFVDSYPALINQAAVDLNGMFNPDDYPTPLEISRRFSWDIQIDPVPYCDDFRVTLQADEANRIKAEIEARTEMSTKTAMNDLWNRTHKVVDHMVKKLEDKKAVFRDSLIGNLAELVELLPKLNITDDPGLEKARREIEHRLCAYDPQDLRDDNEARKEAAIEAKDILSTLKKDDDQKTSNDILDAMTGYVN